eukprot:g1107.t1
MTEISATSWRRQKNDEETQYFGGRIWRTDSSYHRHSGLGDLTDEVSSINDSSSEVSKMRKNSFVEKPTALDPKPAWKKPDPVKSIDLRSAQRWRVDAKAFVPKNFRGKESATEEENDVQSPTNESREAEVALSEEDNEYVHSPKIKKKTTPVAPWATLTQKSKTIVPSLRETMEKEAQTGLLQKVQKQQNRRRNKEINKVILVRNINPVEEKPKTTVWGTSAYVDRPKGSQSVTENGDNIDAAEAKKLKRKKKRKKKKVEKLSIPINVAKSKSKQKNDEAPKTFRQLMKDLHTRAKQKERSNISTLAGVTVSNTGERYKTKIRTENKKRKKKFSSLKKRILLHRAAQWRKENPGKIFNPVLSDDEDIETSIQEKEQNDGVDLENELAAKTQNKDDVTRQSIDDNDEMTDDEDYEMLSIGCPVRVVYGSDYAAVQPGGPLEFNGKVILNTEEDIEIDFGENGQFCFAKAMQRYTNDDGNEAERLVYVDPDGYIALITRILSEEENVAAEKQRLRRVRLAEKRALCDVETAGKTRSKKESENGTETQERTKLKCGMKITVKYGIDFQNEFPEEDSTFEGKIVYCSGTEVRVEFSGKERFSYARDGFGGFTDADGWSVFIIDTKKKATKSNANAKTREKDTDKSKAKDEETERKGTIDTMSKIEKQKRERE